MKLENYQEKAGAISETTKAAVRMRDEIFRLTELVKAQEEYIDLINERYSIAMIVAANNGFIEAKDLVLKGVKLRLKINQLQSKTEK